MRSLPKRDDSDDSLDSNFTTMKVATKDSYEKDQAKTEGLVKPSPKNKPPRRDLRNRSTDTEKDPDLVRPSADNDPDLSQNYKRVASWLLEHVARAKRTPFTPPKPNTPNPNAEHRDGQVWKTETGGFAAKKNGETRYDFKSHESARSWLKDTSTNDKPSEQDAPEETESPKEETETPKEDDPKSDPASPKPGSLYSPETEQEVEGIQKAFDKRYPGHDRSHLLIDLWNAFADNPQKVLDNAKQGGYSPEAVRAYLRLPPKVEGLSADVQHGLDKMHTFALYNSNLAGGKKSLQDLHAEIKAYPDDHQYLQGLKNTYGKESIEAWLAQDPSKFDSSPLPTGVADKPKSSPPAEGAEPPKPEGGAEPPKPESGAEPPKPEGGAEPPKPTEPPVPSPEPPKPETNEDGLPKIESESWNSLKKSLNTSDLQAFAKTLGVKVSPEGDIDVADLDEDKQETMDKAVKSLAKIEKAKAKGHTEYVKALVSSDAPKSYQDRMLKKALSPSTLVKEGGEDPSNLMAGLVKHLDESQISTLWKELDSADSKEQKAVKSHLYLQSLIGGKTIKGAPPAPPSVKPLMQVLHKQGLTHKILKPDGSFDFQHALSSPEMASAVETMTDKELTESLGGSDGANGPLCDALLGTGMHSAGKHWIRGNLQDSLRIYMAWGMPEHMVGGGKDKDKYLEDREKEEDVEDTEDDNTVESRVAARFNQHLDKTYRKMTQRIADRVAAADFGWGSGDTTSKTRQIQNEESRSWIEEMLKAQELGEQQRALLEHAKKSESPWDELLKRNDPPLFNVTASKFAYRATVLGGGRSHADNLRGMTPHSWGTKMSISRKGALQVTADLDRLASVFVEEAERLGVPVKIAEDFAKRCDALADVVEKSAGILRDADGVIVTAAEDVAADIGAPTKPIEEPKGSPDGIDAMGDQNENSGVLGVAIDNDLTEAKAIAKAAGLDVVAAKPAAESIKVLPGLTATVLRQHIDRLVDLQGEIAVSKKAIDSQLKAIKGLEDKQKEGSELLKKAAAALGKDGQFIAEAEKGLLQFTAFVKSNAPGVDQMINAPDPQNPEAKAGDFFGRIQADLGDEIAAKVQKIWETTREDLTEFNRVISPFKITAKTASVSDHALRTAGLADIVVGFKSWLAGEHGGLVARVVGFAGTIKQWVDKKIFRSKQLEKLISELNAMLLKAEDDMDNVMSKTAASSGMSNAAFLNKIDAGVRDKILKNIAKQYGISPKEALAEVTDAEAENLLDYMVEPERSAASVLMRKYKSASADAASEEANDEAPCACKKAHGYDL